MSLESVKNFFQENNLPLYVEESQKDTSTVKLAAEAFGIMEDEIGGKNEDTNFLFRKFNDKLLFSME